MKDFKFFRGYSGTLNVMDSQTYATASLYNPNTIRVEVNPNPLSNNEMERWYAEHVRRDEQMHNQGIMSQTTTVTTVNPKWWMKIKIVLQESWLYNPIGVVFVSILVTIVTIMGIAKLFGA